MGAQPVVVRGLRLRYPETGRVVLHGVDLVLNSGEVKLLLGPSGAGKSSLALTLNGLIPQQMDGEIRGEVVVNGRSTVEAGVPWLTSQVGMVFQDPDAQIATLTVADEVAFGMENLRVDPAKMPARIAASLRRVGMGGMDERPTDALSGGQKQRLVLASTLAMGVSVLVFDEPTANLDPAGTESFFGLLARLKAEGAAILIIEHKLDTLISQVDSVAVLDWEGKIAVDGPPREVLEKHCDLLEELGVWIPQVSELADALQARGIALDPYPLTVGEAVTALDRALPAALEAGPVAREGRPTPGGAAMIEALDAYYTYPGGGPALCGASMRVAAGDFYALVGPNGSGKTTLARLLIGLSRPDRGRVLVGGEDIAGLKPSEVNRRVGYVFQNPEHQFVTLSVYDELAFSLRAHGMAESEVRSRVEPLLEEFGLAGHRDANPFSLSQGQKRRLSVATMLALEPQALILDEPTFGQDRENTESIMRRLRALNERGVTIVVITHDMKLVAEYARTAGVMLDGRVAFEGPVRDLYDNPALLMESRLEAPPLYEVSRRLAEKRPGFPLLMTVEEFTEEICARSDICRGIASFTA